MARVSFFSDQVRYTGGVQHCELPAVSYAALRAAILGRFETMPDELLDDVMVAIDGEIVYRPMLQTLSQDAEVVFVSRIAAG